jgi:hypothetical protein
MTTLLQKLFGHPKKSAATAAQHRRHAHRFHGETELPGATSPDEPNYGAGDVGTSFDPNLVSTGGVDPFANASQPGDPGVAMDDAWQLDETSDDLEQAYQPLGPDPWGFAEQAPTLRNPEVDFGGEFYSSFGPAAIIGGEGGGPKGSAALKK